MDNRGLVGEKENNRGHLHGANQREKEFINVIGSAAESN